MTSLHWILSAAILAASLVTAVGADQTMTAEDYYKSASQRVKIQDLQGAITDLDRAIDADPRFLKALIDRGILHDQMGNRTNALRDFDAAIALNPDYPNAYYNRGVTRAAIGDHRRELRTNYSTVTLLARLRGLSTSQPRAMAMW